MKQYAAFIPIATLIAMLVVTSAPAQQTVPLIVVSEGAYDFEFVAETGASDLAKTTGDIFLEFVHRNTLDRYTAVFPGGFLKGEEKSLRLKFADGGALENIKWFRVYSQSTDEWGVEQIRIYRPGKRLYYELDPAGDDHEVLEWIDAEANWRPPYYANEMIQFLPTPPLSEQAKRLQMRLLAKRPVGAIGDLTVRLL